MVMVGDGMTLYSPTCGPACPLARGATGLDVPAAEWVLEVTRRGNEAMIDRRHTPYVSQRCDQGASVLRGASTGGRVSCIPLGADHCPGGVVLRTKTQP